jgi:hypothetical protein
MNLIFAKESEEMLSLWLIWFECLLWLIICTNTQSIIQIYYILSLLFTERKYYINFSVVSQSKIREVQAILQKLLHARDLPEKEII